MGIPTGLTGYIIALHGAVTGNHVLDNTGFQMSDMRLAVCSRRSVIECIGRTLLALFHTLFKNIIVTPELFNVLFAFHEIQVCVNFVVHGFVPFL